MRVADKMQYDQVKTNIGKNRSEMSHLQNQAATQKRVIKPSDDPLAAARVLGARIDLQGNKQYSQTLGYAKSFLEFTDQSLGELTEVLMRAKELAINQSNDGSANEQSRRVVATEIEQLYNQMIAIGNRKLGDRFIFGGFKTQSMPFDEVGRYGGDAGEMQVHIDKETFLPMNVPGARIFLGEGVSPNGMIKAGPSQVKTIEAFEERKAIEMEEQRVKDEPNLDAEGNPLQMRRPASAENRPVQVEVNDEAQGINLFRTLRNLSISLQADDKRGVQDTLEVIDDAMNQVILNRAQVGSRAMAVDNYMQTVEKQKVENKVQISQLEDADVFATVSDINKTQSTLQATLETSGKVVQQSLMQFLR